MSGADGWSRKKFLPSVQKPTYLPGSFAINATLFGSRNAPLQLCKDAMVFSAEGGGGATTATTAAAAPGPAAAAATARVDISGCEAHVIGKGAARIKALVDAHKVKVTIDGAAALIAPTQLEGCDVAGASAAIESVCRHARVPPGEPVVVPIAAGAVGRLIGRGGSVLKGLQEKNKVSIQLVEGAALIRPLQSDSNVQRALRSVSAIAAAGDGGGARGGGAGGSGGGEKGAGEGLSAPVVVDVAGAAGAVIGKAGGIIKGLKAKYMVCIEVVDGKEARITALHSHSDVEGARQEVASLALAKTRKKKTKDDGSSSGGGDGGGGGSSDDRCGGATAPAASAPVAARRT